MTATKAQRWPEHCPACDSPAPELHPAVQCGGEVQVCANPWHAPAAPKAPSRNFATRSELTASRRKGGLKGSMMHGLKGKLTKLLGPIDEDGEP